MWYIYLNKGPNLDVQEVWNTEKKDKKRCRFSIWAVSTAHWRRHATWVWLLLWKPLAHSQLSVQTCVCVFAGVCMRVLLQPQLTSEPAQLYDCVCHETESMRLLDMINIWPWTSELIPLRSFRGNRDFSKKQNFFAHVNKFRWEGNNIRSCWSKTLLPTAP